VRADLFPLAVTKLQGDRVQPMEETCRIGGFRKPLMCRLLLRNLLQKLFSGDQPVLNQELRQSVRLARDLGEKFCRRDGSFIWFCIVFPHFITLSALTNTFDGIVNLFRSFQIRRLSLFLKLLERKECCSAKIPLKLFSITHI
jgi:hypothetical protein